jgi:hypothetical protein
MKQSIRKVKQRMTWNFKTSRRLKENVDMVLKETTTRCMPIKVVVEKTNSRKTSRHRSNVKPLALTIKNATLSTSTLVMMELLTTAGYGLLLVIKEVEKMIKVFAGLRKI